MQAATEANIRDGSWPAPAQPTVRSLEGRLLNVQELERRGLYESGRRLRESTLLTVGDTAYQRWGDEVMSVVLLALKGLVPVSHALAAMREHG